jgi:signal transduction histidine kinase
MKFFTTSFLLLLLTALSLKAEVNIDSLNTALAKTNLDQDRLNLLEALSAGYKQLPSSRAIEYVDQGILIAKKLKDPLFEAIFENRKGIIFTRMGSYENAIKSHYRAYDIYSGMPRADRSAAALINIGVIYKKQEQYDLAITFYRKALSLIAEFPEMDKKKATIYNNIGIIHRRKNAIDSAMYYYKKSIEHNLKVERFEGLADNYSNMATIYQLTGKYDSAMHYFGRTLDIRRQQNDTFGIIHAKWQIAATLANKSDLNRGIKLYYEIKKQAEGNDFSSILSGIYQDLYEYHKTMNRPDSALFYLELHQKLESTLKNAQINEVLSERNDAMLRSENETLRDLNELQRSLLAKEKTYNLTLLAAVCFLLLLLGVLYFIFNENRKKAAILLAQKDKISKQNQTIESANIQLSLSNKNLEELNKEMEQLVSLIAHDMKSPIDQIKGLCEILKMEMSPNDLEKHGEFFEHIDTVTMRQYELINSIISGYKKQKENNEEGFDLFGEIKRLVERYEILATNKDLHLELKIEVGTLFSKIDKEKFVRILENLLSNALKYAPKGSVISLSSHKEPSKALICISDKGPGIPIDKQEAFLAGTLIHPDEKNPESHGVGLSIVRSFADDTGIQISLESNAQNGTAFTLHVPIVGA